MSECVEDFQIRVRSTSLAGQIYFFTLHCRTQFYILFVWIFEERNTTPMMSERDHLLNTD